MSNLLKLIRCHRNINFLDIFISVKNFSLKNIFEINFLKYKLLTLQKKDYFQRKMSENDPTLIVMI